MEPTIAQEDITRYLKTQFQGVKYTLIGESGVKVTDKNGAEMVFTCNIFGDIMDEKTREIIAISDLPHTLDKLPIYSRPKSWTNKRDYSE